MYHENKNVNIKCIHLTIQFAIMRFIIDNYYSIMYNLTNDRTTINH